MKNEVLNEFDEGEVRKNSEEKLRKSSKCEAQQRAVLRTSDDEVIVRVRSQRARSAQ